MARARLLKPGFFTNDALGEIEPLGRLLFAGLWCLADRDGRLHDRPKRIKAEVLPYDDVDVDRLLTVLEERSFIVRYDVEGQRFIQVTAFMRHQRPHHKEPESGIPPCTEHGPAMAEASRGLASAMDAPSTARGSAMHESISGTDDDIVSRTAPSDSEAITRHDCAMHEPSTGHASAEQVASCPPLTLNPIPLTPNQIQKPFPEAEAEAVAVAVADPEPPAQGADERLPLLVRHWERSTGTTVTPALADWLDSEVGEGTPSEWLRDAISETGANGIKAWKYTQRIIERWRVQGREPAEGGRDGRGSRRSSDKGWSHEAPCRITGQYHDWPNLPGWCERCTEQEPITLESLRRAGALIE